MVIDFFEFVNPKLSTLNKTEKKIFDYVVKNQDGVKSMSIRKLSKECYVSTTTLFRFVKKLGFSGYNEFISTLRIGGNSNSDRAVIPDVVTKKNYNEEYLKNIIESVRVIKEDDAERFCKMLNSNNKIFIFGADLTKQVVKYVHCLLSLMEYDTVIVHDKYELDSTIKDVGANDIVLIFSFSGESSGMIKIVERIKVKNSNIVSVTRADNNIIQGLSDINFYVFSDNIVNNNNDISSRISMIAVIETLIYRAFAEKEGVTY
ncbi:MurR/RpiR family transcriptional regulator [Clostridium chrysemydis]|uniref:MurR/RpiR family transcriptional regulator n=1 Tax=Clostridium chrysemydis TaxID=2665504 RepID=UPI003F3DDC5C